MLKTLGSLVSTLSSEVPLYAYFIRYTKLIQNLSKCCCKIYTWMWFRNFYNVQQHATWFTTNFKMNCDGNKGLMVGKSPHVYCETQGTFILLKMSQRVFQYCQLMCWPLAFLQCVCEHLQTSAWHPVKLCFVMRCNTLGVQSSSSTEIPDPRQYQRASCSQRPIEQSRPSIWSLYAGGRSI